MSRPPVVTGIGVVAPNGLGTAEYWSATCAGVSGIREAHKFDATQYPSRMTGEVVDFDAKEHLPSRLLPQTDHMTRLALVAADEALADAGVTQDTYPVLDMGVVTASTAGGYEFGQRELEKIWRSGPDHVSAYQSFAWFYAVNTGQISIRHGFRGPSGVVVSDQAGGLDAIGQARRQLRRGSKVIVSGGVDGSICPWGWVAHIAGGRMSTAGDPSAAYLPFDERAAGHVPAEGGAILVLEDAEAATARGAKVYGEIAGYAATFDPRPGSDRGPTLRRAIVNALRDAGMDSGEIDVVFADGAAIPDLDRVEADAIAAVFGPNAVPVTAPKTMVGRMFAGAGPVDVAAALLAIRDGVIPPTVNVRPARRYPIEIVIGEPRRAPVRAAVVIARGYGGFNSVIVVRAAGNT
ncbi:MAG TPA: ketosynthase chain-length factor [Actinophytocola sp.]|uniref:ketosynthase chain-length factor n=1 Tax=Actinophytocola sp. TaxID=1872138 RepID=UPI002DDCF7FA|nr:ketosynthase chain-length factor [Actinophytocola sp.]HEV2780499.1 ketosynthase chain-length factor [Actinophytocola sp.]